jgi:hypothetical protein
MLIYTYIVCLVCSFFYTTPITLHNTDFAFQMKIGGFDLFLHDISKYAFSFPLSRTDHLGTEPSPLLNLLI